jgi:hypothetical protein
VPFATRIFTLARATVDVVVDTGWREVVVVLELDAVLK